MSTEQRRQIIVSRIKEKGSVRIIDLSHDLNVSRETIRKDIYW